MSLGALLLAMALADAPAAVSLEGGERVDAATIEVVSAELEAAGFTINGVQPVALVALTGREAEVEVRIDDRLLPKSVSRSFPLVAGDLRARARLAVGVVELLRACLLETRLGSPTKAPVPAAVARLTRDVGTVPSLRLGFGLGTLVTPGGLSARPAAFLMLGRRVGPADLGGQVGGSWPARFTSTGGVASVGLLDARVTAAWRVAVAERLTLRPTAGFGALLAWAAASTTTGYSAKPGLTATPAPSLGLEVSYAAEPWLELSGLVAAGVGLPAITLRLPEGVAARIGQPWVQLSLGVAVR